MFTNLTDTTVYRAKCSLSRKGIPDDCGRRLVVVHMPLACCYASAVVLLSSVLMLMHEDDGD